MMNQPSDNYIAEMLIKGLGAQFGSAGTTSAGGAVIAEAMRPVRHHAHVVDGSGLSRAEPHDAARGRRAAGEHGRLRGWRSPFDESLAVVGRNGTVYDRMRGTAAQDRCHAKTGTLRDVSALAGYCNTTGGRARGVRVPDEPRLPGQRPRSAGPHDGRARALRRSLERAAAARDAGLGDLRLAHARRYGVIVMRPEPPTGYLAAVTAPPRSLTM